MTNKKMFWTPDEVKTTIFGGNISKSTILKLINSKEIPAIQVGHRWYIPAWWVEQQIQISQNPASLGVPV